MPSKLERGIVERPVVTTDDLVLFCIEIEQKFMVKISIDIIFDPYVYHNSPNEASDVNGLSLPLKFRLNGRKQSKTFYWEEFGWSI